MRWNLNNNPSIPISFTIKLPFGLSKSNTVSDTATSVKETLKAAKAASNADTYAEYEKKARIRSW